MKVVFLHTDFRIYWPARLEALNKVFFQRGNQLDIIEIAGKGSPYSFSETVKSKNLNWHILFPDQRPECLSGNTIKKTLYRLLNQITPDIIIAGAIAFPSGALAVAWGQEHNCKIIVFDDAKIEAVKRNWIIERIKRTVYNGVDAMLYPAFEWERTGRYWGFIPEQLFYGIDVVDNDCWATPRALKYDWGNYFVSVGRQIPKKNYLSIAKAYCKYANEVGPSAYKLVLIGDGPEHGIIVDYVNQVGHTDDVIFLPFLPQDELPAIYQNAKALSSSSSSSETWGLVINEAMACGCPIIASVQCGATNTLVQEGKNGFRFSCEDINRLAELMIKIHNLTDKQRQSMREASKTIIADWGLDRFVKGCFEAMDYVSTHPKRKVSIVSRFIIKLWKGRYRPV